MPCDPPLASSWKPRRSFRKSRRPRPLVGLARPSSPESSPQYRQLKTTSPWPRLPDQFCENRLGEAFGLGFDDIPLRRGRQGDAQILLQRLGPVKGHPAAVLQKRSRAPNYAGRTSPPRPRPPQIGREHHAAEIPTRLLGDGTAWPPPAVGPPVAPAPQAVLSRRPCPRRTAGRDRPAGATGAPPRSSRRWCRRQPHCGRGPCLAFPPRFRCPWRERGFGVGFHRRDGRSGCRLRWQRSRILAPSTTAAVFSVFAPKSNFRRRAMDVFLSPTKSVR